MKSVTTTGKRLIAAAGLLCSVAMTATAAQAAPVVTTVNADLASSPFSFSFLGSTFTFTGTGGFPNYLAVSTTDGAAVRTVFGSPSSDFTNRNTVSYDEGTLGGYGSFATLTTIPTTNGENYLGLRVTSGGQNYYGFAFTTDTMLNSYGFETTANTAITATTDLAAAVPETATWMMMIVGLGAVGGSLRSQRRVKLSFA
jgi:hypothetical protein